MASETKTIDFNDLVASNKLGCTDKFSKFHFSISDYRYPNNPIQYSILNQPIITELKISICISSKSIKLTDWTSGTAITYQFTNSDLNEISSLNELDFIIFCLNSINSAWDNYYYN